MCTGPTAVFGDGQEWRAFRTKKYTYAVFKSDGQELLDNQTDPLQMNNLIGKEAYQEVAEDLKHKMYAEMNRIGDNFEKNSYYEKTGSKTGSSNAPLRLIQSNHECLFVFQGCPAGF